MSEGIKALHDDRGNILGRIRSDRLKFATVSGIFTTKPALIEWVDENVPEIEVVTTKSYQVKATEGCSEPIIVETEVGCFGNAVGLRNPGMDRGFQDLWELRSNRRLRSLLNVSLAASSIEDFAALIAKFEPVADLIELNFSCPHAEVGYGASIGGSAQLVSEYIRALRRGSQALLFAKLTPNVTDIGSIARAAVEAGADGIVAINTVGPEVFIEPHTGKPVLQNPLGHRGGCSGEWVRELAVDAVQKIRTAVGPAVAIIGMGGITTGDDVRRIKEAGADVIGVGSALARVCKPDYPSYFSALKEDAEGGTRKAQVFVSNERLARYRPYRINRVKDIGETLRLIELEGEIDYKASQYVFIWLPGVGEKPFSIALAKPLTFVIRKRGLRTQALFDVREGQELMVRGVYGKEVPGTKKEKVVIVTGGTGMAVVPALAGKFSREGKDVTVYYGVRSEREVMLREEIARCGELKIVADDGVLGRVLDVFKRDLSSLDPLKIAFFNVGPVPLMKRASDIQAEAGAEEGEIYCSLEMSTRCGIGMCGECECGGHLTCHEGTFVSLRHLKAHAIDIASFE